MLISDKQQEANRQNAQQSTGPKTPEGKAAVRLNALTYGLRARNLILPNEDPEEYKQLWADLEAEWQPQNRTERMHLEQMSTSQWLLARFAKSERRIYQYEMSIEKQFALLDRVSTQRARLERSFTSAMRELKQLQKERQARPKQPPVQPAQTVQAAQPAVPHPAYVMSEGTEDHPVSCSP
jgi:uncharacterized membrane protein YccC